MTKSPSRFCNIGLINFPYYQLILALQSKLFNAINVSFIFSLRYNKYIIDNWRLYGNFY